jgi:acetyl-CoA carboxylase biotin carboxylase subunit
MKKEFKKLLVANRGEIAIRVMRTCREMGIRTVAVYSDPDAASLHVGYADESYALEGTKAGETYLQQEKIVALAKRVHAEAIHPGYGFLSENAEFAERVVAAGLVFVGPSAKSIRLLGDKTEARTRARELEIPTVPGTHQPLRSEIEAAQTAAQIGYPVLLKAAAGGGGKGMRVVDTESELSSALRAARSEALSAFGDDRVYMEKYIDGPRHIEMQILADAHGNAVYLGERECSIQRRHQKVIEETPSPVVDETLRAKLGDAAIKIIRSAGYVNAGTVEFLVDRAMNFYFLEVNTRLQVEHPVTELVTGLDLVREQILVARGEKLSLSQREVNRIGHALECRIYAEDPAEGFFPSTGVLKRYRLPEGPRVRVDNGFREGDTVSSYYDPMLAKVITWGANRSESIAAMARALSEFQVTGVQTTIPFCRFVVNHRAFQNGNFTTNFVKEHFSPEMLNRLQEEENLFLLTAAAWVHKNGATQNAEQFETDRPPSSKWKANNQTSYR